MIQNEDQKLMIKRLELAVKNESGLVGFGSSSVVWILFNSHIDR